MAIPSFSLSSVLKLDAKRGLPTDLEAPLIKHITAQYQQPGQTYSSQLRNIMKLRGNILQPVTSPEGLSALQLFQAQLDFIQARFYRTPPTPYIAFSWMDTLADKMVESADIGHEQASVLYNIAAVASQLAEAKWRASGEGATDDELREALTWFKMAAAALKRIGQDYPTSSTQDLATAPRGIFEAVFRGQAQEAILARAIRTSAKGHVVSGVAIQAAQYFDTAYNLWASMNVERKHPYFHYGLILRLKAMWRRAVANFYQAKVDRENKKYGEEVSRLRLAAQLCADIVTNVGQVKAIVKIDLATFQGFKTEVDARLKQAEKENELIYHEKVPSEGQLPEIQPNDLANVELYQRPADAKDVLATLLSLEVHIAASEVTERAAAILREAERKAEEQSDKLEVALSAMELETHDDDKKDLPLPPSLFTAGASLRDVQQQTPSQLAELIERMDGEFSAQQARVSALHQRLQAVGVNKHPDLPKAEKEAREIEGYIGIAQPACSQLRQTLTQLEPKLQLLAGPHEQLRKALPRATLLDSNVTTSAAAEARIKELLGKVQLLKDLRRQALAKLRDEVRRVDVAQNLVTAKDQAAVTQAALNPLQEELKKLEDNFVSQAKLLPALVEAYAAVAESRQQAAEMREQQQNFISGLEQAYATYTEIQKKVKKAVELKTATAGRLDRLEQLVNPLTAGIEVQRRPKAENAGVGPAPPLHHHHRATSVVVPPTPHDPTDLRRLSLSDPADHSQVAAVSSLADMQLRGAEPTSSTKASTLVPALTVSSSSTPRPEELAPSPLDLGIEALRQHIARLEQVHRDGQTGFEKEFALLRMEDLSTNEDQLCSIALRNNSKNRYRDILPYDSSRVVLESRPGVASGDGYINACHVIDLLPGCPRFVCAQGPLPDTVDDFWKMIYQQRARVIVMVTNLTENDRPKCEQYWPQTLNSTMKLPATDNGVAIDITLTAVRQLNGWIERDVTVEALNSDDSKVTRHIRQFHYTAWPDRGVPESPDHFLNFLNVVKEHHDNIWKTSRVAGEPKSPIAVHCSAGVGRTGTFCLVYAVVSALPLIANGHSANFDPANDRASLAEKSGKRIDVTGIISHMRKCRRHMVQTLGQFEFCYRCSLRAAEIFNDKYGAQYRRLKQPSPQIAAVSEGADSSNNNPSGAAVDPNSQTNGTDGGFMQFMRKASSGARSAASSFRAKLSGGWPRQSMYGSPVSDDADYDDGGAVVETGSDTGQFELPSMQGALPPSAPTAPPPAFSSFQPSQPQPQPQPQAQPQPPPALSGPTMPTRQPPRPPQGQPSSSSPAQPQPQPPPQVFFPPTAFSPPATSNPFGASGPPAPMVMPSHPPPAPAMASRSASRTDSVSSFNPFAAPAQPDMPSFAPAVVLTQQPQPQPQPPSSFAAAVFNPFGAMAPPQPSTQPQFAPQPPVVAAPAPAPAPTPVLFGLDTSNPFAAPAAQPAAPPWSAVGSPPLSQTGSQPVFSSGTPPLSANSIVSQPGFSQPPVFQSPFAAPSVPNAFPPPPAATAAANPFAANGAFFGGPQFAPQPQPQPAAFAYASPFGASAAAAPQQPAGSGYYAAVGKPNGTDLLTGELVGAGQVPPPMQPQRLSSVKSLMD